MEKIEVCVRTRPLNDREITMGEQMIWKISSNEIVLKSEQLKKLELAHPNQRLPTFGVNSSFVFNNCFTTDASS